ncbi:MAG: cytochrome c oxidase subunit 3 [Chloroflexota bacterium]|nr:cytochrome c oxidase subunit 3 [Chloroflexota bacterium]MCY3639179.1 cytochrome c oxidase subunit 3 [Chloroflexota bacterium]MDE2687942.1 cytochrome c oxidase subunit 3 [Chloroflexota bacterium]
MAQATAHHGEHEPTTTGLNHRKMLMWAFLGSDCMFFGTLIATYLVYKNRSITGPLPEDVFSIPVTTVSTFVLLMSSMSMVLAYAALTRNSMKAFRIWLASTCILGATFVGFQVYEFTTFANYEHKVYCADVGVKELTPLKQGLAEKCGTEDEHNGVVEEVVGLTPRTNLFGTTFYTLTGFHGAHVTLGIVWLLSLFFLSFKKGMVTPERNLDLDLAALYWHFVDIVWIVIFTVVYLFGVFPGF